MYRPGKNKFDKPLYGRSNTEIRDLIALLEEGLRLESFTLHYLLSWCMHYIYSTTALHQRLALCISNYLLYCLGIDGLNLPALRNFIELLFAKKEKCRKLFEKAEKGILILALGMGYDLGI